MDRIPSMFLTDFCPTARLFYVTSLLFSRAARTISPPGGAIPGERGRPKNARHVMSQANPPVSGPSKLPLKVLPTPRGFGKTQRKDAWWVAPLLTFLGLSTFVVYST